jgi:hypothetical protein
MPMIEIPRPVELLSYHLVHAKAQETKMNGAVRHHIVRTKANLKHKNTEVTLRAIGDPTDPLWNGSRIVEIEAIKHYTQFDHRYSEGETWKIEEKRDSIDLFAVSCSPASLLMRKLPDRNFPEQSVGTVYFNNHHKPFGCFLESDIEHYKSVMPTTYGENSPEEKILYPYSRDVDFMLKIMKILAQAIGSSSTDIQPFSVNQAQSAALASFGPQSQMSFPPKP